MNTNAKRSFLLSAGTPLLVAAAAVLAVGDLNPPAGSVAATGKRLAEIEPRIAINATNTPGDADSIFKITQSGSYYLTGNVVGAAGMNGIEIGASNVTLDLNGFMLIGSNTGSLDGIRAIASAPLKAITVRNGSLGSWGGDGIDFSSAFASGCTVENIQSSNNAGIGITVGPAAAVFGCVANENGTGISTGLSCTIKNSVATFNTGDGFRLAGDSAVSGCTATDNGGNGIMDLGGACSVTQCIVTYNAGNGISVSSDCLVVGNTCDQNGFGGSALDGAGILATSGDNRIEGNNCTDNECGIDVNATGNIILRNTCSGNTPNWDVVAGNTILVVQGTSASAILGNTGGAAPGSTDPNANFTY